jgi:adenine-specific DNA-methyltransferase
VSTPSQAVDDFLDLLQNRRGVDTRRSTRATLKYLLLDLEDKIGDPAWTDGCDVIGTTYERAIQGRDRRRLGQFFTPIDIGRVLSKWVLQSHPSLILDPGCGSGSLLIAAAHEVLGNTQLLGLDIDPLAVQMSRTNAHIRSIANAQFRVADFLTEDVPEQPDGIICNPPYTRHHSLSPSQKRVIHSGFERRLGIDFSQMASLHVLFLVRALEISSPNARIAFLTPSHWLDRNYGVAVKKFLLDQAHVESIVNIPASELVFDHAITTATITLIQKGKRPSRSTRILISSTSRGTDIQKSLNSPRSGTVAQLTSAEKWTQSPTTANLGTRIGDLASIHRGIATGCNQFFTFSEERRRELRIAKCSVRPCLPAPRLLSGTIVTNEILESLPISTPRWLLTPTKVRSNGPLADYLSHGLNELDLLDRTLVQQRVEAGRPWYQVGEGFRAPIVLTYINRGSPRFVRNKTDARTLNNWLVIEPRAEVDADWLFSMLNQRSVIESIRHNSREYGKGMWKIEPSELANLRLPKDITAAG